MGDRAPRGMLYVIVCAAPPAAHVQDLVKLAQAAGWEVAVTATSEALAFIDARSLPPSPATRSATGGGSPTSLRPCPRPTPSWSPRPPSTRSTGGVGGITNTVAVGTLCEFLGLQHGRVADVL
jgi:hypothetical protein